MLRRQHTHPHALTRTHTHSHTLTYIKNWLPTWASRWGNSTECLLNQTCSRSPLSLWISFSWICMLCAVLTFIEATTLLLLQQHECMFHLYFLSLSLSPHVPLVRSRVALSLFLSDITIATASYYRDNSRLIIFESGKKLFARVSATTTATPCATTDQSKPWERIRPDYRQHVGWNVRVAYVDEVIARERRMAERDLEHVDRGSPLLSLPLCFF